MLKKFKDFIKSLFLRKKQVKSFDKIDDKVVLSALINVELFKLKTYLEDNIERYVMTHIVENAKKNNELN